jgi:hypothetical protein
MSVYTYHVDASRPTRRVSMYRIDSKGCWYYTSVIGIACLPSSLSRGRALTRSRPCVPRISIRFAIARFRATWPRGVPWRERREDTRSLLTTGTAVLPDPYLIGAGLSPEPCTKRAQLYIGMIMVHVTRHCVRSTSCPRFKVHCLWRQRRLAAGPLHHSHRPPTQGTPTGHSCKPLRSQYSPPRRIHRNCFDRC